ncbi:hypothetical protein [Phyllobacterium endophyticum]|nr:hypothetical protein [Phyllobacterium endophyticum]MBB3234835.1 hypothetical protein [Phyllobacterium endophyticum]
MASTDCTNDRSPARSLNRAVKGRVLGAALFVTAFAFHVALLFDLLPS